VDYRWRRTKKREVHTRQPTSVFTDAAGAFEFDLKKSGSFDFVFSKKATHCRTKHYNWQHP
jgi:hypothetical protein